MRCVLFVCALFVPLLSRAQAVDTTEGPRFVMSVADSTQPFGTTIPDALPAVYRKRIAIGPSHLPRHEALRRIAAASGLQLVYANDLIRATDTVRLEAAESAVHEALSSALRGTGIDIVVAANGTAILRRRPLASPDAVFGVVDGLVADDDLIGISGAEVRVLNTPLSLMTSEMGRFRVTDMSPGSYVVTLRKIGFQPLASIVTVAASDTVRLSITLERMAVGLDTVRITATSQLSQRLSEFVRRRKAGMGHFMNAADIAKLRSDDLGSVMRALPGVVVARNPQTGTMDIETRRSRGFLSTCPMLVLVDEVPMPTGTDISMLPSPKEIAAIEAYTGLSTAPSRYTLARAACGVVLIWTKTGG